MDFPNVPFKEADDWTPELATLAFNSPIFDGETSLLGHRAKINDTELSDTGVKLRLATVTDNLKVSQESSTLVRYKDGKVLVNHQVMSIAGGILAVPDGISYVYVSRNAQVEVSSRLPVISLPLAKVTTVSGIISVIEDIRALTDSVLPKLDSIRTFGGTNQEDKICTQGEVLDQGEYYFRNFTVPVGVSITVQGTVKLEISGDMVVDGEIIVNPLIPGTYLHAVIEPNGYSLDAVEGGGLGGTGAAYPYGAQPWGSSGFSPSYFNFDSSTVASVFSRRSGAGGGSFIANVAGTIKVNQAGSIRVDGGNGNTISNFMQGNADGFDVYVFNGTLGFEGGGTGSGGGSGGFIRLSAVQSVSIKGLVTANGGNGGNAILKAPASVDNIFVTGGGGGGGGVILIMSPDIDVLQGDIQTEPGIKGSNATKGTNSTAGNTITFPNGIDAVIPGGRGAGFGGGGGIYSGGYQGQAWIGTYNQASQGKILYRNFLPVA